MKTLILSLLLLSFQTSFAAKPQVICGKPAATLTGNVSHTRYLPGDKMDRSGYLEGNFSIGGLGIGTTIETYLVLQQAIAQNKDACFTVEVNGNEEDFHVYIKP